MASGLKGSAEFLFNAGCNHLAKGDSRAAEAAFRRLLTQSPNHAEALANLGLVLDQQEAWEEAEVCYRRAASLAPEYPQVHLNLGALMTARRRLDEAETAYRQALALEASADAWTGLGAVAACRQLDGAAEACYRQALRHDGQHASARFNPSYILLRHGCFEEGWECFEARPAGRDLMTRFNGPRWTGDDLSGRAVVVAGEGGYGDVIQFCRYGRQLRARGARWVAMVCQAALVPLLRRVHGLDEVCPDTAPLAWQDADVWTPLMSLPGLCGTRLADVPAPVPYVVADTQAVAHWDAALPAGFRVGLVWRGNPRFHNDEARSLPNLATLAPVLSHPEVRFVSLQTGPAATEATVPGIARALGGQLGDFAATAAVVANLDLVISVDTAVAHLAGAMGRPCWVLLPGYLPDWRWLIDREDSPWYPSLRLFRQPRDGSWATVVEEVAAALEALVGAGPAARLQPTGVNPARQPRAGGNTNR